MIVISAAAVGFLCVALPPYWSTDRDMIMHESPLFPMVRDAIENLHIWPTVSLLFLAGLLFGWFQPKTWLLAGFSMVLVFLVATFLEILVDTRSHNLWFIEIFIYLFLGTIAALGSFLASRLRRKTVSEERKPGK